MMRRIGICILCFVFVSQTVAGCASMTQEQKSGLIGASLGAALGAVAGGLSDPGNAAIGAVIGAVAGALVGGAAGWAVGAYQVKQVKSREQTVTAKDYTSQQGVMTTIERTEAMPKPVKPGDQLILQAEYTVLAPPENGQVRVWEVRAIFFNGQQLTVLPQRELALSQGKGRTRSSSRSRSRKTRPRGTTSS